MAGEVGNIPWRDVVPRFAADSYDVQVGETDEAGFVEEATAIIAAFEERFQPGQPVIKEASGKMIAGTVGEDPIKATANEKSAIVQAFIPQMYVSGLNWYEPSWQSDMPWTVGHRKMNSAIHLLQPGAMLDSLRRTTSPARIAVGTEEITAFVAQQHPPIMELAALVALRGAGIETDLEPTPEASEVGSQALVNAASRLAVLGSSQESRERYGLHRTSSLVDVNGVLKAEKNELRPRIQMEAKSVAASYRESSPSASMINYRLELILEEMFPESPSVQ